MQFVASDGELTDTLELTITLGEGINAPPVLTVFSDDTIPEGALFTKAIRVEDPDQQETTVWLESGPEGATLNGTSFQWTPRFDQDGEHTLKFPGGNRRSGYGFQKCTLDCFEFESSTCFCGPRFANS